MIDCSGELSGIQPPPCDGDAERLSDLVFFARSLSFDRVTDGGLTVRELREQITSSLASLNDVDWSYLRDLLATDYAAAFLEGQDLSYLQLAAQTNGQTLRNNLEAALAALEGLPGDGLVSEAGEYLDLIDQVDYGPRIDPSDVETFEDIESVVRRLDNDLQDDGWSRNQANDSASYESAPWNFNSSTGEFTQVGGPRDGFSLDRSNFIEDIAASMKDVFVALIGTQNTTLGRAVSIGNAVDQVQTAGAVGEEVGRSLGDEFTRSIDGLQDGSVSMEDAQANVSRSFFEPILDWVPGARFFVGTRNSDISFVVGVGDNPITGSEHGDRIVLSNFDDFFSGGVGADALFAFGGDDTLEGGQDDDFLFGGEGNDTILMSGVQENYTITISQDHTTVEDRRPQGDGNDHISSIEYFDFRGIEEGSRSSQLHWEVFSDPADLPTSQFSELAELYIAYFNRAADALGLYFWASRYAEGMSIQEIAENFFTSTESQAIYGGVSGDPTAFITQTYFNVLGRAPDAVGLNFWLDGLVNNEQITPATFIIDLIAGAKAPSGGAGDRDYLEAKSDLGIYFAVHLGMSNGADAKSVMDLFDGSSASLLAAKNLADNFYRNALDPQNGALLVKLDGVLDNPFENLTPTQPPQSNPIESFSEIGTLSEIGERDDFEFVLSSDLVYTISQVAENEFDLDTFLRIFDESGVEVASNDDFGESFNSQLIFQPNETGIFTVSAGSYLDSDVGAYELLITSSAPIQSNPIESFSVIGALSEIGERDDFEFLLSSDLIYTVSQVAENEFDLDTFLRIFDENGVEVASNDDFGESFNSQLIFQPNETGIFTVNAGSYLDADVGAYELLITSSAPVSSTSGTEFMFL